MAAITFLLDYNSVVGEDAFITGEIRELQTQDGALPMKYGVSGWEISIETNQKSFDYHYFIRRNGCLEKVETPLSHHFEIPSKESKSVLVFDKFDACHISKALSSSAFSNAIKSRKYTAQNTDGIHIPVIFNVWTDKVDSDHTLAITGSDNTLGKWAENNMKEMNGNQYPKYTFIGNANKINFPLEYKYVVIDKNNENNIYWEKGNNRYLCPSINRIIDSIIVNDGEPDFGLPAFKGAGTAVPIFSLRSQKSLGCGEFSDLKLLVDWTKATGQKIIQTLPINDTTITGTWKDSYPYSAISVFALHPIYININKVGEVEDMELYEKRREELAELKFVDYEETLKLKMGYLKEIYKKRGSATFKEKAFAAFLEKNSHWLKPYAVFCYLRDKFGTSDYTKWEEDAKFSAKRVEKYCTHGSKEYKEVAFFLFIQYHLHKQLKEAVAYAHENGIAIKGDIPIGVNRHSVETWMYPELFDRNGQAGAPPDDFSKTGQNWGFPIYNWEGMAKDNYRWWKLRFENMAEYFDAYRIDHILGFFRIFRIPSGDTLGLMGQFTPSLPLSEEEIRNFGIEFDPNRDCEPVITENFLDETFGEEKMFVQSKYLVREGERFHLKPNVNTQAKIANIQIDGTPERSAFLKFGLMILTCQTLFIKDYKEKGKYHPRISVQQSNAFRLLDCRQKEQMNRLYSYYYYQRQDAFWKDQAMEKLPALTNATNLLACGEDLGMVPTCVPQVMDQLGILSLEIQRMPKEMGVEFGRLERNPYLSVSTTSTHDMSTMRSWWEEDRARTQRYFNNELNQYGMAPLFCEPWICQQIIERHLASPSIFVILPLQDWMALDGDLRWKETASERINDPANPNNYWRYRMHITLERLIEDSNLSYTIRSIISQSKR